MANTSTKQDQEFGALIIPHLKVEHPEACLDEVLEWVRKNLNPDDVFSNKQLEDWAEGEGYKKEE